MFTLIGINREDNSMLFFGPFPNESRAETYARAADRDYDNKLKWVIRPLIVPHFVMPIRFVE